jgi:hypothetical protein
MFSACRGGLAGTTHAHTALPGATLEAALGSRVATNPI